MRLRIKKCIAGHYFNQFCCLSSIFNKNTLTVLTVLSFGSVLILRSLYEKTHVIQYKRHRRWFLMTGFADSMASFLIKNSKI